MLYVRELPPYTTERYYILSEIEQAADFDFSFQASDGQVYPDEEEDKKWFYYVLWDVNDGLNGLKDDLHKLCGHKRGKGGGCSLGGDEEEEDGEFFNRAQHFLGIEVLASKESQEKLDARIRAGTSSERNGDARGAKDSGAEHEVEKAYKWIQETYPHLDFVAFGTSDKLSGTPAVEILQQIICFAYRSIDLSKKKVRVLRMEALLGFDEDREPDAESDVTQALYTSRAFSPPKTKESKIDFGLVNGPVSNAIAMGGILAALCAVISVFLSSYFSGEWFHFLFSSERK